MRKPRQLTYVQTIALGFFLVIMCGTLLLMLPVSSADGSVTPFVPSLFTATSASCVTGLVMVDTGTHWSFFGQAVILVLIQIGGLGFMTIATLFSKLLRRRMSMHERGVMAASISSNGFGRITEITSTIGWGTLLFEGAGALLLCIRFIPEARCDEIRPGSVVYTRGGSAESIPCDYAVISVGSRSRDCREITDACAELGIFCRVIGDARSIGNALDATSAGMDAIYELLEANA